MVPVETYRLCAREIGVLSIQEPSDFKAEISREAALN